MKDEFIIINKTQLLKRIEELEKLCFTKDPVLKGIKDNLLNVISQSTPLIPEIEKAWYHGYTRGYNLAYCIINDSECLTPDKEDYISNLKLDI